ncbi:MAG: hypothetical protein MI746_16310, partial [Pseudomonadales bacterium]|nr:hypothetical protein [Pseudomonadales bacterium]
MNFSLDKTILATRSFALASLLAALTACISYEPAQLVPAVTLSAEEVSLISSAADADQVDFGVDVTVN